MRVESVDPISDSETVPFQNVDYLFDISKSSNLLAELNRLLCTEELIILPVDLRKVYIETSQPADTLVEKLKN